MHSETEPTLAPLDYSPPRATSWVGRHRRLLILMSTALTVAVLAYRFYEPLARRAQWLYWSRQCATYVMPTDAELRVTDPKKIAELIGVNWDYVHQSAVSYGPVVSAAESAHINPNTSSPFIYVPRAWRMLRQFDVRCQAFADFGEECPIAFMGSLERPDGQSRLVVVSGRSTNAIDLMCMSSIIVMPHPGLTSTLPTTASLVGFQYSGRWESALLKIGVEDPRDPTHLILPFQLVSLVDRQPEETGIIDVYLQNDDSLRLKLQETPQLLAKHVRLRRDRIDGRSFDHPRG